jgi:DNA-binding YbaB/EbfC family protein
MSSEGPPPSFDLGALVSQLGQVQQNLREAQEAAAAQVVEGSAGGGAVKVKVTGALTVEEVTIDPAVVDPEDVEMLQDLVLAAVRDGLEKATRLATDTIGGAGGLDIGGALGGLGLGGMLGQ